MVHMMHLHTHPRIQLMEHQVQQETLVQRMAVLQQLPITLRMQRATQTPVLSQSR